MLCSLFYSHNLKEYFISLLRCIVRRIDFTTGHPFLLIFYRRCNLTENASYSSRRRSLLPSHLRRSFSSFGWLTSHYIRCKKRVYCCLMEVLSSSWELCESPLITVLKWIQSFILCLSGAYQRNIIMDNTAPSELGRFVWNQESNTYTTVYGIEWVVKV